MAFPFGNHPTFLEYLQWCCQQGCTMASGYMQFPDGSMMSRQVITAPNGKHVTVMDMSNNERLMPSTVAYFDRRLGLDSPFAKIRGYDGAGD